MSLGRIYMKMGDNLRAQGFFMQALIISKEIMEKENITVNGYGENIRLMAQTCANRGDRDKTESFAESLIAYRKAAKGDRHPRYAAALYESAMLMIEVGNYSRAEEYLTGASEITETMLGNDTEPCRSCLCELCRVLYIQKKYEQAADRIKKAVSLCRKYDDEKRLVDIMFLQAEIQYCLGYKRKAEEIAFRIDNMVLRSGDNRQLYLEKQAEYIRLMLDGGDYARAAERLKAACGSIEDEGNKAEYFGMLAEAHFGNGDYAQALDAAEECLKYERDEAKRCGAYIIKAASGLKVGKYAMANEVLSETLFIIEKNTELYKKYAAQTYCLMAEGYYMSSEASSAADCLEMGLKKAKETESLPMDEYLRYLKLAADISVRLSRYDRAVEYLSEAALILRRDGGEDGDFADMLMKTAETYMLSRRFSDAEAMYKRAAEIFDALGMVDEGVDAELGVCNALSGEGRYEALAERIEKMKAYGNRNGEFSRLLALAYKNTGALGRLMRLKIGKGL